MKLFDPKIMKGGWFVGDFEPAVWRTTAFEVGYKHHQAGEPWDTHYHEHMEEVTFLLEGQMKMQGTVLTGPVIFLLDRGEVADPEFITDCKVVVVKMPSVPGDKVIVKATNE